MATKSTPESAALRDLIHRFIHTRLQAKLDKLKPDEGEKRQQLLDAHRPTAWLADAAFRAGQLQLATHTLKPTHPDARGSNLHAPPQDRRLPGLVSSHCLGERWEDDVVGNSAALDVFKLLKLEYDGKTLLQRLLANDPATLAALDEESDKAGEWRDAFVAITESRGTPASHTLAKQLYFPLPDGGYHLLAPLFPTSLVHRVHKTLRNDRFGDAAKAAREARRNNQPAAQGYGEYPDLAIQNFGGAKPQNISQLNSERHGENWLLASLPPQWKTLELRPPLNTDSAFDFLFRQNRDLRTRVNELQHFLLVTTHNNWQIRRKRARLLSEVAYEFHQFAARLLDANRASELDAGWSARAECRLPVGEQHWLDPLRVHQDEAFMAEHRGHDWPGQVSARFGNWLNHKLNDDVLRLSDAEAEHWEDVFNRELSLFREVLDDERA